MAIAFKQPPPRPDLPWVTPQDGRLTISVAQYQQALDAMVRALAAGQVGTLVNAANDAAAKAAGVAVGSLYRNGSVVQVRVV
jgi:hypothetical protein